MPSPKLRPRQNNAKNAHRVVHGQSAHPVRQALPDKMLHQIRRVRISHEVQIAQQVSNGLHIVQMHVQNDLVLGRAATAILIAIHARPRPRRNPGHRHRSWAVRLRIYLRISVRSSSKRNVL